MSYELIKKKIKTNQNDLFYIDIVCMQLFKNRI